MSPNQEIIDRLINNYYFLDDIEHVFRDPEDEDSLFVTMNNGYTFHLTIKVIQ